LADAALTLCRRREVDPPWDLIAASSSWANVVDLVGGWFESSLSEDDGAAWDEIGETEEDLGLRLPWPVREWFALVGGRSGVWHGIDEPISLESLRVDRGEIVLSRGHQGISCWSIKLSELEKGGDQGVYHQLGGEEALVEPLRTFYCRLLLTQIATVYDPPAGLRECVQRWTRADGDLIRPILQENYQAVGGPRQLYGVGQLYRDPDTIIVDDQLDSRVSGIAVRSEDAADRARRLLGSEGWGEDRYRSCEREQWDPIPGWG